VIVMTELTGTALFSRGRSTPSSKKRPATEFRGSLRVNGQAATRRFRFACKKIKQG
jgi:hypothetical protein